MNNPPKESEMCKFVQIALLASIAVLGIGYAVLAPTLIELLIEFGPKWLTRTVVLEGSRTVVYLKHGYEGSIVGSSIVSGVIGFSAGMATGFKASN